MTLGEKIQKLRKQKGFSQEALAEKVTVTRQTISKWELNQSTPDLDFIAQLSNIFNVSSDYLIKDELVEPDELQFKKRTYKLSEKFKTNIFIIISIIALISNCICVICDYFTSKNLSWSFIVIISTIAVWLLILPLLTAKTKIILKTLIIISVIPIPFLSILALLLKKIVILKLGTCISLVSIISIWIIYVFFCKYNKRLWRTFGLTLLIFIPLSIIITHLVAYFIPQKQFDFTANIFNSLITLSLSLVCFCLDYLSCLKKKEVSKK